MVGLVIAKQSARTFQDKENNSRSVLSFTLRDSLNDYINCTVWGSQEFVENFSQQFYVQDVVEIQKFQVQVKSDSDDKFNPFTSTAFTLHLGENQNSEIQLFDDLQGTFEILRHGIIRPENDYYKIAEINEQSTAINGQNINLLAVVKKVGNIQQLTSKTGKKLTKLQVQLCDETCGNFSLLIWDMETSRFAQSWSNRNTILFASDVRVSYNEYSKCMNASATSKSIFLPNPDSSEAHRLYQFAKQYDEQISSLYDDTMELDDVEPCTYTVAGLMRLGEERKAQINQDKCSWSDVVLRGIVFGAITSFDIDGNHRRIWSYRCASCRRRLPSKDANMCGNNQCPTATESFDFKVLCSYDMLVSVSDHTGTLDNCRIGGNAVERMIGMPVEEYQNLSEIEITKIKWNWLLERCKVKVRCNFEYATTYMRIENCERADPDELMRATILPS